MIYNDFFGFFLNPCDSMNVNFFVEKAYVLNNDNIKSFFNMTIEKFGSVKTKVI